MHARWSCPMYSYRPSFISHSCLIWLSTRTLIPAKMLCFLWSIRSESVVMVKSVSCLLWLDWEWISSVRCIPPPKWPTLPSEKVFLCSQGNVQLFGACSIHTVFSWISSVLVYFKYKIRESRIYRHAYFGHEYREKCFVHFESGGRGSDDHRWFKTRLQRDWVQYGVGNGGKGS